MPRRVKTATPERRISVGSSLEPLAATQVGKQRGDVVVPSSSLVASAVRYKGSVGRIFQGPKDWQREVYRFIGIIGEARYAAAYYGHALSRCQLYAQDLVKGKPQRLEESHVANRALAAMFNGEAGQSQMLYALGFHLSAVGECYIVGRSSADADSALIAEQVGAQPTPGAVTEQDIWEVVPVTEMHVQGREWSIHYDDLRPPVKLKDEDIVIRVWQPHPEKRIEADSAFRSLIPVLTELEHLTLHIFAQCRSRLASAGLLLLSKDMTFPDPPPRQPVEGEDEMEMPEDMSEATKFMHLLADSFIAALEDPGHPSSVVPITAMVPHDVLKEGKAAQLLHFWSDLDKEAAGLRKDAVHRFALGMDMPPEKLLGMSSNPGSGGGTSNGVSHWGAWQVDEETVKLHVEPMLEIICNAITITWVRLASDTNAVVRYDTVKLRLRPDRTTEAFQLWDRFLLSDKALFREVGFDYNEDLADEEEIKERILRKVASGSATPEQVQAALKELGIDLGALKRDLGIEETRESRPDPSVQDLPQRELPERPAASIDALVAASNALCFRALERVGNRLRTNVGKTPGVPSWQMHTLVAANGNADNLLADAFAHASQVLTMSDEPQQVVEVLEAYVRSLLTTQAEHDPAVMSQWLTQSGVAA